MIKQLQAEIKKLKQERNKFAKAIAETDDPIGQCPWCAHPIPTIWAGKVHVDDCPVPRAIEINNSNSSIKLKTHEEMCDEWDPYEN
jgi:hypothetical protein